MLNTNEFFSLRNRRMGDYTLVSPARRFQMARNFKHFIMMVVAVFFVHSTSFATDEAHTGSSLDERASELYDYCRAMPDSMRGPVDCTCVQESYFKYGEGLSGNFSDQLEKNKTKLTALEQEINDAYGGSIFMDIGKLCSYYGPYDPLNQTDYRGTPVVPTDMEERNTYYNLDRELRKATRSKSNSYCSLQAIVEGLEKVVGTDPFAGKPIDAVWTRFSSYRECRR